LSATELRSALRTPASALAMADGKTPRYIDACATIAKVAGSCPCLCPAPATVKATRAQ
jgi:hypothetical protein